VASFKNTNIPPILYSSDNESLYFSNFQPFFCHDIATQGEENENK
jgi:hypothetical protein